jgi:hypothetical protein
MGFLTKRRLLTAALAAGGVAIFYGLNLPLPFLLGPLAACLIAALAGAQLQEMGEAGKWMRTVLGVAVGAAVTPELFGRLPDMALSIALVPVFVLVIGGIGYPFFRRLLGYDAPTAYYAAMPGGLQDMLLFGQEAGGNVRTLSLIHATRVLVIVSLAPILITGVWGVPLINAPGAPALEVPPAQLLIMLTVAVVGWRLAAAVRLFGAPILGPLILAAALSLTGILQYRPPAEAILAAQYFIGVGIGAAYTGITMRELRKDVLAGVAFCLVLAVIALVFAEVVSLGGLAPPLEAFLAFAPGGQAEMVVLTLVAGADLAFVVTHHLVRLIVVILGAPIFARLTDARKKGGRCLEDRGSG